MNPNRFTYTIDVSDFNKEFIMLKFLMEFQQKLKIYH